jgi:hypothetical protein
MKKQIIIEIETSNMMPVYDSADVSKHTPEHERVGFFEEQIFTGIRLWIREQLQDEYLNQAILDELIPDFKFQGIEGWNDLSQYGTIKVSIADEDNSEVVCFFQREKIPLDENYIEDETEKLELEEERDEQTEDEESEEENN